MTAPTIEAPRPKWLGRYLRDGERAVVVTRRHVVAILEPWLSALTGLLIFAVATVRVPALGDVLLWLWFALVARALAITLNWSRTWFVATNKRLLLVHGFVIRKVAMMPLTKVTDMTYGRSVLGRVLGYGTFLLESAGQDQALRMMDHIPDPDRAYRSIIAEIFPADAGGKKRDETSPDRGGEQATTRPWSSDGDWGAWPDGPVVQRGGSRQPPAGDTDRLPAADVRAATARFAHADRADRADRTDRDGRTDRDSRDSRTSDAGRRWTIRAAGAAAPPVDAGSAWDRTRRAGKRFAKKARHTLLDPAPEPYRGTAPGQFVVRHGASRPGSGASGASEGKRSGEKPLSGTILPSGRHESAPTDDAETLYASERAPERLDSLSDDGERRDGPASDPLGERPR